MKVLLLELGDIPPRLSATVLENLPSPYRGGKVKQLALDMESCRDRQRGQVDAACLLQRIPLPPPGWTTLALTGVDLFLPALTYVFGVSQLSGFRGVLSLARLQPEKKWPATWPTFVRRTTVEAVHELGHTLGLVHCPLAECPMHRTLWPEAIDLKHPEYCPVCLKAVSGSEP